MDLRVRGDFPVTSELTYLDTAYDGPYPLPVLRAAEDFLDKRSRGVGGRVRDWLEVKDQVRSTIADLVGAKPSEVAVTRSTTEGTNIVATSLSLGPGDNVVWDDLGYPSNSVVWLNQERLRGVENRVVQSKEGRASVSDFERVVDSRTRVISISSVSHRNGHVHDVKGLAELAHARGAYLHVDAIQAVGAIGVDVKRAEVDFLTCGTYKWLLGPLGLGFLYVREALLPALQPVFGGDLQVKTWTDVSDLRPEKFYEDARKFERATMHYQGVYELRAALAYINRIGMDEIEEQVLRLSSRVWTGMDDLGLELITPQGTRSGIVACVVSDAQRTAELLADHRIVGSVRAGNELRVSPHFFNTEREIDHLLSVLELLA
ncbi:MAG TPA: aminotransferase class V-fold PLP-dependent enzyme [Anaerolineae bacterium]|nr:aminotransferase class V-fold PLP-dependent enzyme [Anaerolineae bacterium]